MGTAAGRPAGGTRVITYGREYETAMLTPPPGTYLRPLLRPPSATFGICVTPTVTIPLDPEPVAPPAVDTSVPWWLARAALAAGQQADRYGWFLAGAGRACSRA